jgi:hypothetical protein
LKIVIIRMTNLGYMQKYILFVFILFLSFPGQITRAQIFMPADSSGDAYTCILNKGYGYEVPDCVHDTIHIAEHWNTFLRKPVFEFMSHRDIDNDRCINFDRQRTEIKTWSASPDYMVAFYGQTMTFRWKFLLDSAYQPSPNFCHIHQIKAGDGPDSDSPLMTISPRYNSSGDKLQIIFTAPSTGETSYLSQTPLEQYKGVWIDAIERVYFAESGSYSLTLRRVNDDSLLLNYTNTNVAMWRDSSTYIRPKYGIYRSLNSVSYLRDETIKFADFSLYKGTTINIPAVPGSPSVSSKGRLVTLTWIDYSGNEDQFRIERSSDNLKWRFLGTSPANTTQFVDTVTNNGLYYYRLRSENTCGSSEYSGMVSQLISSISAETTPVQFSLSQNFPNPFNPVTTICFFQTETAKVKLSVFDILGNEVRVLKDDVLSPGQYSVSFDASSLASGAYYYKLTSGSRSDIKKLLLLK